MNKIYFKQKNKCNNIEELLISGYRNSTFKETFKNEACTVHECHSARRSFGDLLCICKTYFPKTTRKDLAKTIVKLNKKIGLRASYCNIINKLVFLKDRVGTNLDRGVYNRKSFKGDGTVSYSQFIQLSKIK